MKPGLQLFKNGYDSTGRIAPLFMGGELHLKIAKKHEGVVEQTAKKLDTNMQIG